MSANEETVAISISLAASNIRTELHQETKNETTFYINQNNFSFRLLVIFLWQFSGFPTHTQMLGGALLTPTTQSLKATRTIAMLYPTHRLLSLKVLFYFVVCSCYFVCFCCVIVGFFSLVMDTCKFLCDSNIVFLEPSIKYQRIFIKREYFYQRSTNQH